MKVWTDVLTSGDLWAACPAGVDVQADAPVSARLRANRFEHVRLSTEHGNRWPNGGQYGGGRAAYDSGSVASPRAATYDEHGAWMARLFARDPNAIIDGIVRYDGEADFHRQTNNRYADDGPANYIKQATAR